MTGWTLGPGIVALPDGRRIRGRGLRARCDLDLDVDVEPEVGYYLLAKAQAPTGSPAVWIKWRDFRRPADELHAFAALTDAYDRCATERVEIACAGGRGRTGCAIAVLAVLGGIEPQQAVGWVRANYDRRAIETPWQRRWIEGLEVARIRGEP